MIWPDAQWSIATVKYAQSFRDWTKVHLPRKSVSILITAMLFDVSVRRLAHYRSCPKPARRRLIDLGPELLFWSAAVAKKAAKFTSAVSYTGRYLEEQVSASDTGALNCWIVFHGSDYTTDRPWCIV